MNQDSAAPSSKMTAVGAVGLVVTGVVGLLTALGVKVPENLSGAVTTLVVALLIAIPWVAGYLKQERAPKM